MEGLRKYTDKNSFSVEDKRKLNPRKRERFHQASQDDWNPKSFL